MGIAMSDIVSEADQWTVASAKARLSEAIERAMAGTPQIITRNGKRAAVLVGIDEWEEKTRRKGTLAEFFMNSPLRGSEIEIERVASKPRDIDF
jgi:prevent-host-death family protein